MPTTSDCMYVPNVIPPVRRVMGPLDAERLYSLHSIVHSALHSMFYNMPEKTTDRKVRAPIWYPEINPEDSRKWSSLNKQTADVNIQKTSLALTPPQEGGGDQGTSNIDVVNCRGPGGMTALHLASCRGLYLV